MKIYVIKNKVLFGNIIFLLSFVCLYGGGYLDNYGYVLLMIYIIYSFMIFPQITASVFFSRLMLPLYLFLIYYLLSSNLNFKIVLSLFGKLSVIPLAILHFKLLSKYPFLDSTYKRLMILIIIVIGYFCVRALLLLAVNPLAMRELISTNKDESIIVGGGFGLPYSLSLLLPALLPIIKDKGIKALESTFFRLFSILGILVIFMTQYMTALIILLVGYFFVLISKYKTSKQILVVTIFIALFFNLYIFLPDILNFLGLEEYEVLYRRMNEVVSLVSGNNQEASDFSIRMNLSLSSLETFSKNILLGIGYKYEYSFFKMQSNGVGMHAEWFDLLAIYGLFVLLLFHYFINAVNLYIGKSTSIMMFILLGFLNPILSYQILFVVFYLIPLLGVINSKDAYETQRYRFPN